MKDIPFAGPGLSTGGLQARAFAGFRRSPWPVILRHSGNWPAAGRFARLAAGPQGAGTASAGEPLDLDAALMNLAPPVQLCVVLAYHEGLSHSEVSTATSLPLGTVKFHLARGAS